jgi:hypothetical protein
MKAKFFLFSILSLITISSAFSQDNSVTEEELMRYATAMDSINEMSAEVIVLITDMVKNTELMNAARYNELSKIVDDETKLTEANATPEEISFIKEVAEKKDSATAHINEAFQSLAKDYVTVPTYTKVKKALSTDAALKEKYDALMTELAKDNPVAQ